MSADERDLLEAVAKEVIELERLCGLIESSASARDWQRLDAVLADCRRTTHALRNALHDSDGRRDEAFEKQLRQRIKRILDVREISLVKMREYYDGVGDRLRAMSKWKGYARSIGGEAVKRSAGLDSIR